MKLKSALVALALTVVLVAAMQISASYAHFAETPPTIDGIMDEGEWAEAAVYEKTDFFFVYVFNDFDYLYVGFQALGGTYLPTGDGTVGIMNVYIWNPGIPGQGWAYCWINRDPDNVYMYSYPGRVPTPTAANFDVTDTVFELQIPLSELGPVSLGDTIVLTFLSYSEGLTDWSTCWLYNRIYTLQLPPPIPVYVDIKPGSWPNPINTVSKGVFAVAICGTEDFDVTTIDPTTVKIYIEGIGVSPLRWSYEDVATPYTGELPGGHDLEGDGYLDLVLHFNTQQVVTTLTLSDHVGETIMLIVRGNLNGGPYTIEGQDYVWILG